MSSFTEYHKKWKEENGKIEDSPYKQRSISEIQESTQQYLDSMFGSQGKIWEKIQNRTNINLNQSNNMQKVIDANTRNQMARNMEDYVSTKRTAMQNVANYVQEKAIKEESKKKKNDKLLLFDNTNKSQKDRVLNARNQKEEIEEQMAQENNNHTILEQVYKQKNNIQENKGLRSIDKKVNMYEKNLAINEQNSKSKKETQKNNIVWQDFEDIAGMGGFGINTSTLENVSNFAKGIQDAVGLGKLVGLGTSSGGKEVLNYIESTNENNFSNYRNLKERQFSTSPNVSIEDKTAYKMGEKIETNLVKKAIRDSISKDEQNIQEIEGNLNYKVSQKLGEIAPSMGQMLPGMALNTVNPILGGSYFMTSAGGGYINDGLNRGMTEEQAWRYGTIMGALEGASDSFITGQQVNKIANAFGGRQISKKVLESYGFNIFENAVQEAIMEPAQEITAGIIGDKADWSNMEERMRESGFNGALMGVITNGVTYGLEKSGMVYNKVKNKEQVTIEEYREALQENINKFGKEAVENSIRQGALETYQEINKVTNLQQNSIQNQNNAKTGQITNQENKMAQNGNIEQIDNSIANNQQTLYNNTESEGGVDGREEVGQGNGDIFKQFTNETNPQSEKTNNAREEFENRFREATRKRITEEEISENSKNNRKILKDVYDTDIFFIEDNLEFSGGADEKLNLINLTREIANSRDNNVATGHELFEVIRNTREDIKNEYIEPLIDVVKNDNNFNEVLKKYVDNCETKDKQLLLDNPRYIAKEILFDEAGFMFNEDEFKLGVNKQETDLIRFSDYLDSNKSILQIGLSNIEQKARTKNITSMNNKVKFNNIQKENNTDISPYRTMEEIANDNTISDIQAFQEATKQLDTPSDKILQQRENELSSQEIEKSPTIDYIKQKRNREKTSLTEIKDTLVQKFVNKGHYIDKLAKQTGNNNLTYLYDRTMNTFNEAQISIGDYQINSNGEKVGKSIIDIFEPAKKANLSLEFDDYLLNKHNVSRYAHEKGVFGDEISAIDSKKIVEHYENKYPDFKEWSNEVSKYNDNNLRDLVDNGMVSEETYKKLKEMYGDYVPTYRDITDNISQYIDESVGGNTLGKATQSDREILSISESMAEQTLAIKKAVRINNLGLELYNTLGKNKEIMNNVQNFDPIAMQTLAGNVIEKATDGSNIFTIFKDGEMTQFRISDELYTAFSKDTLQSKINNSKVAKAMLTPVEKLSKAQRELLTTYSIGFAFNNPIKDIQDALFNSKYSGASFAKNYTKALYNIATKGSWYESYKNNGGTANTYYDYSKGILPTKTKNPFKKFENAIKKVNEVIEQAPRLAEYISTIEHGESIDQALYNAAEVTTNFKRGGDITKAVNKYGANFLNASIQGLDKLYRNLSGQRGWKGYANILTKATVYMITPAIINSLLLGDDEDYEDLPEYIKDEYFLFKTGEGKFFRIPKGRTSSVIGGLARRCLEASQGKEVDWKSLVDTTKNQLAPNNPLKDNIIAPIKQAVKNEAWYGGEIVSSRFQKLPVAEQYDESTDELSKLISTGVNKLPEGVKETLKNFPQIPLVNSILPSVSDIYDITSSPKKLNYVLDQYSGGIGDVLLPIITPQAENNILEDKFTTDSVMKSKYVSEYYSKLEELEKNKNSQNATDEDKLKYKYMSEVSENLSDLYNKKREIQNSNKSDKLKKMEVREVQNQINSIVEERLEKSKNIKTTNLTTKVGDSEYYKYNEEWTKLSDEEKEKNKNISLPSYADYKNKTYNLTKKKKANGELKEKEQLKNKDKIGVLLNSKYSNKDKEEIYKNYIGTEDKKIQLVDKLNFPLEEYLKYKQQDFKNDKDKNGESISGTGKQKVYDYLNNISSFNLSDNYKKIICKIEGINDYDKDVVTFINDYEGITNNDKKELLKNIGYKIDEEGYVITTSILPIRKYVK